MRTVLAAHPYKVVEKFIAEVFWRTYWKGWLELHRGLWAQVKEEIQAAKTQVGRVPENTARYNAAVAGRTGIEAFDHWADELNRTGYLHNWARMQVASIWTFTLGLPWQLGADWMFSRLLDADPASNTLSWRWVAGLHTAGKAYLADGERIAAMTDGSLKANGLATTANIPQPGPAPVLTSLREPALPDPKAPSLILLTCEDLSLETQLELLDVRGIVFAEDIPASAADQTALQDAGSRAMQHWKGARFEAANLTELAAIASKHGCTQIVTGFSATGPVADALQNIRPLLAEQGIAFTEHQRRWDRLAWPHCAKGFFQLKTRIPSLLHEQGITDRPPATVG